MAEPPKTNTDIMTRVQAWQITPWVHPLTCGQDSNHRPLVAFEDDGAVLLRCLDCDYRQASIPDVVLGGDLKHAPKLATKAKWWGEGLDE